MNHLCKRVVYEVKRRVHFQIHFSHPMDQKQLSDIQLAEYFTLFREASRLKVDVDKLCRVILPKFEVSTMKLQSNVPLGEFQTNLEEFCSQFTSEQLNQWKTKLRVKINAKLIRFQRIAETDNTYGCSIWFGEYTFGKIYHSDMVTLFLHNSPKSFQNGDYVATNFFDDEKLQKIFPHFCVKTYIQKIDSLLQILPKECQEEWCMVLQCVKDK